MNTRHHDIDFLRRSTRGWFVGLAFAAVALVLAPVAQASFGIESFSSGFVEKGGGVDLRAGAHPYELKVHLKMKVDAEGRPEGTLSQLIVQLPAGIIADPLAVPRCPGADFEGQAANCPGDSQVGFTRVVQRGGIVTVAPLYDLTPRLGVPASLGFSLASFNSYQEGSLRTGSDYGITSSDITLPTQLEIQELTETVWGVPADPSHDSDRVCVPTEGGVQVHDCESEVSPAAFLSLPTVCAGPLKTTVTVASVEEPFAPRTVVAEAPGEGGAPEGVRGCDRPPFAPAIKARPETSVGDSPTGLHVNLHVPQNENPDGFATAHLKNTIVTLPQGLVVNPSAATGLGACSSAQVDLQGNDPAGCPDTSKVGTVTVQTPLVDHPLPGAVYLARQTENPFGSLLALYIVVDDPITGVIIKLAGKVEPDPMTGRLKASFLANPQLPFEDLNVDFFGGPRAALTTPSTCGTFTTSSALTPWTSPEGATATPSDAFQITAGANDHGCVASEAREPNRPAFEAGTTIPLAGSYSPFVLKLSRENGTQRLGAVDVTLPPGLTGRLAGVQECSDGQLAVAAGRNHPGEGALEQTNPSCPQSSEVGTVVAGAGSGSPLYVGGHAYLAGPYEGAPLSLAIITPTVAGPFDLGNVVVRSALFIDPNTAQVTVKSDPIPTILQGIPLDIRSIAVTVNRPEFTLNPTSCEPMSVTGEAVSTLNQTAGLSERFQVGGCQGLAFKPSFTASTQGKTSKANGASLTVKVSQKPGEANIHKIALTLPLALPARLTTLQKACTEAQFAINPAGCPPGSFIGTAKAITPVLSTPLTGPAILVSHGGAAFPDVVFLLQGNERGGTIRIDLDGRTDIKKGITYSRFETVPDAPITSFETSLPQGPHSVLAATGNLCTSKLAMPTQLVGQNGALVNQTTKITVTGCPKTKTPTRAQKLALALKACHKKPKGAKRSACEHAARKKYGPVNKSKKK
jgi:hypothetical protein